MCGVDDRRRRRVVRRGGDPQSLQRRHIPRVGVVAGVAAVLPVLSPVRLDGKVAASQRRDLEPALCFRADHEVPSGDRHLGAALDPHPPWVDAEDVAGRQRIADR
eukprot:COSAG03_NODE_1369_length_4228_cov_9.237288_4_plen_105_part_00